MLRQRNSLRAAANRLEIAKGMWNEAPHIFNLGTMRKSGQIHTLAASFQITEVMTFLGRSLIGIQSRSGRGSCCCSWVHSPAP